MEQLGFREGNILEMKIPKMIQFNYYYGDFVA